MSWPVIEPEQGIIVQLEASFLDYGCMAYMTTGPLMQLLATFGTADPLLELRADRRESKRNS